MTIDCENVIFNLVKIEFCNSVVQYLSHIGNSHVKASLAKVDALVKFPVPRCKKELINGWILQQFCIKLSTIVNLLNFLLKKNSKYNRNEIC